MLKVSDYLAILSIIAVVMLFGATGSAWAQTPAAGRAPEAPGAPAGESGKQPRIEFTSMEHDFGQAPSGESLTTSFEFKNAGDGVLVIEKVKGG